MWADTNRDGYRLVCGRLGVLAAATGQAQRSGHWLDLALSLAVSLALSLACLSFVFPSLSLALAGSSGFCAQAAAGRAGLAARRCR